MKDDFVSKGKGRSASDLKAHKRVNYQVLQKSV